MKKMDVSVVLNMHREALYLRPTLLSLDACAFEATKTGIRVELIAVFDRPDKDTLAVFHGTSLVGFETVKTTEIDVGSLGLARNAGIELAEGEYIWTADGDDLVSRNAIVQLIKTAHQNACLSIAVFVEYWVAFGEPYHIGRYFSSDWLTAADFAFHHPYVSRVFVKRSVFESIRYRDLKITTGFAYEDWDFNNRLVAANFRFLIATNTVIFYRQRCGSLVKQANAISSRITPHSDLFVRPAFRSLMEMARAKQRNWQSFLEARQRLHERTFAAEFLESKEITQYAFEAGLLDPEIEPNRIETAPSYCSVPWNGKHWGFQLERFYELVGNDSFSDVVLLPWLKPGGAEKYILQILAELRNQGLAKKILVLTGQRASKHEWVTKLPRDAVFIDLYNTFPGIDDAARIALATRAMLAISDKGGRLHLKPSEFAHQVMEIYGAALATHFKPIYYRFSDDRFDWKGYRLSGRFGITHLRQQMSHIYALVSDCEYIIKKDAERLGVSLQKHHVIYARCDALEVRTQSRVTPSKRLLWASRVSKEKRPELLILLASALCQRFTKFNIDVFGPLEAPFEPSFFNVTGVKYCGVYGSFSDLPINRYDALVYTSSFDGLPNVILEAMGAGLPVIAPAIGGIGEAVVDGETGCLLKDDVNDASLVESYVKAIEMIYSNWNRWSGLCLNARKLIKERHGDAVFSASVAKVFSETQKR